MYDNGRIDILRNSKQSNTHHLLLHAHRRKIFKKFFHFDRVIRTSERKTLKEQSIDRSQQLKNKKMSDKAPKISIAMNLGGDKHCTVCGKDIYRSSTGCLCGPKANIVDGPGTFGEGNNAGLMKKGGGDATKKAGEKS